MLIVVSLCNITLVCVKVLVAGQLEGGCGELEWKGKHNLRGMQKKFLHTTSFFGLNAVNLTLCQSNLNPYCLGRKAAFFQWAFKCTYVPVRFSAFRPAGGI
jgi:hypothetical protein